MEFKSSYALLQPDGITFQSFFNPSPSISENYRRRISYRFVQEFHKILNKSNCMSNISIKLIAIG